ncbi:hypothetical protein KO465_00575 [Candidatus Micrarchaeota archaeon]|nr:hypothetical protein [Candidatus Micrarchaeota archaeon]
MNDSIKWVGLGIVVLLIVFGIYVLVSGGLENQRDTRGSDLVFNNINKQKNIIDFYVEIDKIQTIETNSVHSSHILKRNNDDYYSHYKMSGAELENWLKNDKYYICYNRIGMEKECFDATNNSVLTRDILEDFNQIPSSSNIKNSEEYFGVLFNTSAYNIVDITEEEYNGRMSECLEINIEFEDIRPSDLTKMGISSSNKLVTAVKNYSQKVCYDDELGYPLYSKITYVMDERGYTFESVVKNIGTTTSDILEPETNTTREKMLSYKSEINKVLQCSFRDDRYNCLWMEAQKTNNPLYCMYITNENNMKGCLYYLKQYVLDPRICEVFEGDQKNNCYYEMAKDHLKESVCEYISDNETKKECVDYINQTIEEIEKDKLENAECFTDADCHITGGLNQFCRPLDVDLDSTIYTYVYECLPPHQNLTSCKCVDYKCTWEQTEEYLKCYDEWDEKATYDYISQIQNEKTLQEEYCTKEGTNYSLSYSEAVAIAELSECTVNASLTDEYMCNAITGTWWIDLDLEQDKCNPACVVDVENETATINWRCTGLINEE